MQTPQRKTWTLTEPQTYINMGKNKNIIEHLILPKESQFSANPRPAGVCIVWCHCPPQSPLALMMSTSQRWDPPCKPVLTLPGTEGLFVVLPWKGKLSDDATLVPQKKGWSPVRFIAILILGTTIPCFKDTICNGTQCLTHVFSVFRNILRVTVRIHRDCWPGVGSTNPENRSRMQWVHGAPWPPPSTGLLVPVRAGLLSLAHYHQEGEKKPTARRLTFSICGIHHWGYVRQDSEQSLEDCEH